MVCRCEDLEKCKADKDILSNALHSTVNIVAWDNEIQKQLWNLMKSSPESYTTENIDEICTAMNKLNDDIKPAANQLMTEICSKIEELEEYIKKWKEEDTQYHEAEQQIRMTLFE